MTPQERQLVCDLFDRLARLETLPRDAEAERSIAEGLSRAPHAIYPLVQTVLLQEQALKQADARIRELESAAAPPPDGSFLDRAHQALLPGHEDRDSGGTSVPTVRPSTVDSRWGLAVQKTPSSPPSPSPGGSFLGTAAASTASVVGGALLYQALASSFGRHGQTLAAHAPSGSSPWGDSAANSDLARDAGLNDIAGSGASGQARSAGLFGDGSDTGDAMQDLELDAGDDFDFDGSDD
jgi:hypothetical protein